VRFITPAEAVLMHGWEELAGPFGTLLQAEQWVDHPPDDVGDPGDVTIFRGLEGRWYVMSRRQRMAV